MVVGKRRTVFSLDGVLSRVFTLPPLAGPELPSRRRPGPHAVPKAVRHSTMHARGASGVDWHTGHPHALVPLPAGLDHPRRAASELGIGLRGERRYTHLQEFPGRRENSHTHVS